MDDEEFGGKSLSDYLDALKRRKLAFLIPVVIISIASLLVAYKLPAVYRSTGTILIEQQEIPQEWVNTTVTSFADQRIELISQRVLTTENLTRIIEKFGLYTEERKTQTIESITRRMREDFNVRMISADRSDRRSRRSNQATIAFTISFDSRSPQTAQKVANELVSLYLEENLKTRSQAVEDTARFLTQEANKLGDQLAELESKIAVFKEQNSGLLPEDHAANIQRRNRTEEQILESDRRIQSLEERKIYLDTALAQISPYAQTVTTSSVETLSPEAKLRSLESQYLSMKALYGDAHPDIIRVQKEINALRAETGAVGSTSILTSQLSNLQNRLGVARERYSEEHPDVKRLKREILTVEQQLATASKSPGTSGSAVTTAISNPAYIELRAEKDSIARELLSLANHRQQLTAKLRAIEDKILEAPHVERQQRALIRDHENMLAKYHELRAKQSNARLAEALEEDQKGERFTLIEPPRVPKNPIKPDRKKLAATGTMFSFAGGIGLVILLEMIQNAIRGPRAVAAITHAMPLTVVPYIQSAAEIRKRKTRRWVTVLILSILTLLSIVLIHFLIMPLDVLWFSVMRKIEEFDLRARISGLLG